MISNDAYLEHHGIKGMRWGVRRYQNKDGSLTPLGRKKYGTKTNFEKVQAAKRASSKDVVKKNKARLKAEENTRKELEKYKKKAGLEDDPPEFDKEAIRKKTLSSTDASEIYKNRDLLTTTEINERLNRIETEAKLARVAEGTKVTGRDKVNDMLQRNADTIGKATNLFKKVDDAYSSVANSAIGKALAKQLGLELPKKELDIDKFIKDFNKHSTEEILDFNKNLQARVNSIKNAKILREADGGNAEAKAASDALKNAQKQVDDYIKSGRKDDRVSGDGTYSKSGKDITDSKVGTGSKSGSNLRLETKDYYTATADDVIGKGKSTFNGWKNDSPIVDVYPSDVPSSVKQLGYTKVAGYLEDKSGR